MRYVAFLFGKGFSHASISSCLSAVSFWCNLKNWPLVTQSFLVARAVSGVWSLSSGVPKDKFLITPDILRSLCQAIHLIGIPHYDAVRLRAMFLIAFHAFLRVSEFCASAHTLRFEDVTVHSNCISIRFPSFKFSQGRCPMVFIPSKSSVLCPVEALLAYIRLRGSASGFLFRDSDGHPVSSRSF